MPENIFVLGLDDENRDLLERLPGAENYRFHQLLDFENVRIGSAGYDDALAKAQEALEAFEGPIDAICGYWDFPVTSLVPVLCERFGLPSASLESIAKCEHKYWSRLEQREVIDEYPRFALIDVDNDKTLPSELAYPVWLKPVKSASSKLAFKVGDDREFTDALAEIREGISDIGGPFDSVLERLELPREVAEAGGRACIAEETAHGEQVTVEGYCHHHEPHVYGIVDSVNYPGTSSFLRYQYPSTLPAHLAERIGDISKRIVQRVGLRSSTFDIEFFVDVDTEEIRVLEVNPRLSQSHAHLFENVDGAANHLCMVSLALGKAPEMPHREGRYGTAAKYFLRRFTDGVVRRVPTQEEVARVEREIPGVAVDITTEEGARLSEQYARDSYSFELADIHVGAADEDELKAKYERCVAALPFEFDD